ncbi:hypothetical protein EV1_023292 [Malus domestica]
MYDPIRIHIPHTPESSIAATIVQLRLLGRWSRCFASSSSFNFPDLIVGAASPPRSAMDLFVVRSEKGGRGRSVGEEDCFCSCVFYVSRSNLVFGKVMEVTK